VEPNVLGTTSDPNATVTNFAQTSGGTPNGIRQGVSNAMMPGASPSARRWRRNYLITASAVDSAGFTTRNTTRIVPNLVIDTVGPFFSTATFDCFTDTSTATHHDNLIFINSGGGDVRSAAKVKLESQPITPARPHDLAIEALTFDTKEKQLHG
jgi:hypothetical protein